MKDTQDLKMIVNQKYFSLASWVKRNSLVIKKLRAFSRGLIPFSALKPYITNGAILNYRQGHNTVVMAGRGIVIANLAGDHTNNGEISYGALGIGDTAFTDASTKLTNEVYRTIPDSTSYEDDIAYADFFIAVEDVANQTFKEWGTFLNGTSEADSGFAFSLFLTGDWVKTGSMFISSKYQLTNA